jgi:hypothetical protein
MALIDIQEQVRAALYDVARLQFVVYGRVAIDFAAAAGTGRGTQVTDATFVGALLGDCVLWAPEVVWEADMIVGVPQVSAADNIVFGFSSGNGAVNPASHTCRVTVLRPM